MNTRRRLPAPHSLATGPANRLRALAAVSALVTASSAVALACLFAPPTVAAAERFAPPELFAETARAALPAEPVEAHLAGDAVIVVGTSDDGRGHVASIDAKTLRARGERALGIVPVDVVVDARGTVFVVGDREDGVTRLLAMDARLEPLGAIDVGVRLVYPQISVPVNGRLVVGSLERVMQVVDVSAPAAMVPARDFAPPDYSTGVGRTWTSRDDATLFVNLTSETSLVAFDIASTRRLGEIGYRLKGGPVEPFTVAAQVDGSPCGTLPRSSFLVADTRRGSLTLAEFDADFRSLDIVTAVDTGLEPSPDAAASLLPGGNVVRPSALVASNCDSSVVWVGSTLTSAAVQYAVNADYGSLEKIGSLDLGQRPAAFAIAPDGAYALMVSADGSSIVRYEPDDEMRGTRAMGDPAVRELQRLLTDTGYPVGTIDGLLGPATRRALNLYESDTGARVDIERLDAELESIGVNRASKGEP